MMEFDISTLYMYSSREDNNNFRIHTKLRINLHDRDSYNNKWNNKNYSQDRAYDLEKWE